MKAINNINIKKQSQNYHMIFEHKKLIKTVLKKFEKNDSLIRDKSR